MSARLVFGPNSRRRLYAVRRLRVMDGALARGPLLGVYQASSPEDALCAARRDFPGCCRELLAAVDQIASLQAIGGETLMFAALVQSPDGSARRVLLTHDGPDVAFRCLSVTRDFRRGDTLHFAAEGEVE